MYKLSSHTMGRVLTSTPASWLKFKQFFRGRLIILWDTKKPVEDRKPGEA